MILGRKKYRKLLAALDQKGVNINIRRIGPKWYEVHENFVTVKKYKLRASANGYVRKAYEKHVGPLPATI